MIRRFIPKGTSLDHFSKKEIKVIERHFSKKEIKVIENWINNYPRKIFGFKSSNEIYNEKNSEKTA